MTMTILKLLALFGLALLGVFPVALFSALRVRRKAIELVEKLEAFLPGYDCGLCGSSRCHGYAVRIACESSDPGLCVPAGRAAEERIRSTLGEIGSDPRAIKRLAVVRCGGDGGTAKEEYAYEGIADCEAAKSLYGGPKRCKEGCLGFGSCLRVCPHGAIEMSDRLAWIDARLCDGCGRCAELCPTGAISLVSATDRWYVACSSHQEERTKAEICDAACVACGECVRRSYRDDFSMNDNLAVARGGANGLWSDIAPFCPTKAIVDARAEKNRRSSFRKPER